MKSPGPDRMAAVLKTPGEIDLMDRANRIVHQVLDAVGERMVPGVKTRELDHLAERIIRDAGGVPAFLRYRGYPATLCISVNDVIVHGIPGENPLQEGDIVGIDCGVFYKGYCGDAARTFAVGRVSDEAKRLLRVTEEALKLGVAQVRPGGRVEDIGSAGQRPARSPRHSGGGGVTGHGGGALRHQEPAGPHFGS